MLLILIFLKHFLFVLLMNAEKFSSRAVLMDVTCRNCLTGIDRRRSNFGNSSTHWLFRFPLAFPPPFTVCLCSFQKVLLSLFTNFQLLQSINICFISFFSLQITELTVSFTYSLLFLHIFLILSTHSRLYTHPFLILPTNSGFSFPIIISSNFTSFL